MTNTGLAERLGERVNRQTAAARRRCPRCNGNLFLGRDDHDTAWHCLQCGRTFVPASTATAAERAA